MDAYEVIERLLKSFERELKKIKKEKDKEHVVLTYNRISGKVKLSISIDIFPTILHL